MLTECKSLWPNVEEVILIYDLWLRFLWVEWQLRDLCKLMRESDIRTRLGKLPKGLRGVYDEIMNSIKSQPDCNFILATCALKWMLVSKRPLTPQELIAAVELNPSLSLDSSAPSHNSALAVELLIQSCEGFLLLDTVLNVVRFSHLSAQEYLEMPNEMWHVSITDAQLFVSECCLWVLQSPLESPLYKYAASNWFHHCRSYQDLILSKDGDTKDRLNIPLLNSFLGSFKQASPSYSRWGSWIRATAEEESQYITLWSALSTPLYPAFSAAFAGLGKLVRWLWDREGNEMRIHNDRGSSLLDVASEHGTEWVVAQILKGAQIEDVQDALCLASKAGNYDITKLLLDQGTDVNIISRKYGTALAAAASKGQQAVATLLLDRGADVNIIGGEYGTALAAAAYWGRVEVVTLLLDRGADVNIIGGECGTALGAAAYGGGLEAVTILLDRGADVNMIGGQYGTALGVAAYGSELEAAILLLDRGADVNIIGGRYGTALAAAAYGSELAVATLLLDRGADVNIIGGEYGTALGTAAYWGRVEAATLLLDRGADVNIIGGECGTALAAAAAAYGGGLAVATLLLDRGADIDIIGCSHGTALGAAAYKGELELVTLLLNREANPDLTNIQGSSPRHLAKLQGHEAIVDLLDSKCRQRK